jgi:hypothetical protein
LGSREPRLITSADRDERTFGDQTLGERETEAVRTTGDEKCSVLYSEVHECILGMNTLQRCSECPISVKCGELFCDDVGHFGG